MVGMKRSKKKIAVLLGPTASGKTNLAVQLSQYCNFEVISADSRQIYKYLNIGTAKPLKEEINLVEHHLIDFLKPSEYYSAGLFEKEANDAYNNILKNGKYPILLGGSGLYIKAFVEGFSTPDNSKEINRTDIKASLEKVLNTYGKDFLYAELKKVDPEIAQVYSDRNPRRIIRALEYYYTTGMRFSETMKDEQEITFEPLYFGIHYNRETLYDRINKRVDMMWQNGLIDEVKQILDMGFSKDLNSLNTVGYKETISYLDNLISEEQAIELIKRNTRRYAKRQTTWFKSIDTVRWIRNEELNPKKIASDLIKFYNL